LALIASYITKFGIIQVSDFNPIINKGDIGNGQKIFPISHLNASLVFSGSNTINGVATGTWMKNFIEWSQLYLTTINDFSFHLFDKMNKEMREDEKNIITEVYIAGYQRTESKSYPEHWCITNARRNGDDYYSPLGYFHDHNNFQPGEVEYHRALLREMNDDPLKHQFYINGFPLGRIGNNRAMVVKDKIDELLKYILKKEDLKFRCPASLSEFSNVVKLYFDFMTGLLKMEDGGEKYPGGEIHIHEIPAPADLRKG
jgi:hypothetical protein